MAFSRPRRLYLISLLLLVLVTRALVPQGFMPAGDGSAQLTLCPDGMLMPGNPGHLHTDHCPFGSAPFAAPLSHTPVIPVPAVAITHQGLDPAPRIAGTRVAHAHQPRAPPFLGFV